MQKIKIKENNFLKKIFIKFCRKFGFELIDQNKLLIPTSDKNINENINILNHKNITLPLGEVKITRKINSLLIIFRSFTNENKLLSQNKKRIFEKEKKEYTFRSLQSICKNITNLKKELSNFDIFLKIIDDNSKIDVIDQINKICQKNNILYEISNLNIKEFSDEMKFQNNERMLSHNAHIYCSKKYAKDSKFDLLFFVEDDYIHEDDALIEMVYSYQKISSQLNNELIMCPADYPYLYIKSSLTKNFVGFKKHWCVVNQSLCTYLISKQTLIKYWSYYEDMFLNNYDPYEKPLHELYKKVKCFSPIPSLSLHLTNVNSSYGLSPLKDWVKIWENNKFNYEN